MPAAAPNESRTGLETDARSGARFTFGSSGVKTRADSGKRLKSSSNARGTASFRSRRSCGAGLRGGGMGAVSTGVMWRSGSAGARRAGFNAAGDSSIIPAVIAAAAATLFNPDAGRSPGKISSMLRPFIFIYAHTVFYH